jgi:hypothetical protein
MQNVTCAVVLEAQINLVQAHVLRVMVMEKSDQPQDFFLLKGPAHLVEVKDLVLKTHV